MTTVEVVLQWLNEHEEESAESAGAPSMDVVVDAFMHAAAAVAASSGSKRFICTYIHMFIPTTSEL
jgi:hypothetical protein